MPQHSGQSSRSSNVHRAVRIWYRMLWMVPVSAHLGQMTGATEFLGCQGLVLRLCFPVEWGVCQIVIILCH